MKDGLSPTKRSQLVTPRAIRNYAQALGWKPVPGINGTILVFHRPDSNLHQLIVPLDMTFDDYAESVTEAVRKLAAYEKVPPSQVLDHLLLPPADVLRFQEVSEDAEDNTIPLDHASNMVEGFRKSLLSVAHSILRPQPYHPRLSRHEAEEYLQRCRLAQTARGSFTFQVACPVDPLTLTDGPPPLGRNVTAGLMEIVQSIAMAVDSGDVDKLSKPEKSPLLSANLCEALLFLRPSGGRSKLRVAAGWSKAIPEPPNAPAGPIEYTNETFESLEYLIPKLRQASTTKEDTFIGYVESLRGQADGDNRMSGEVVFSLTLENRDRVFARAELTPELYAIAGSAHLNNIPVYFRGTLTRSPRNSRVENLTDFHLLGPRDSESSNSDADSV